jgi:hypothetical protein
MKRLSILLTTLALSAFASVASAQTLTASGALPTPGPYDISVLYGLPTVQNNDGLNYWWNNAAPIGETFTTGTNSAGYTMTSLALKTAGGGGGSELNSQTFTLNIYSISGTTATLLSTYTATNKLTFQGDWMKWTGLGTVLSPNTQYAYTFAGGTGWEEMANCTGNPYAGGQICTISSGTVTYGTTGVSCATFDVGLALGTVAGGTAAITDIGYYVNSAPTPGPYDISQLLPKNPPTQDNDGLNYYWNDSPPIGETFTTGNNSAGYTMTGLTLKTAGGGGGSELNSQTFTLRIYSISGGTATLLSTYTATGQLLAQNDWMQWTGLGTFLSPNSQYAYTFAGGTGWEEMANCPGNPYAGGQICTISTGGGTVNYGATGVSCATFDVALALGSVASGTAAVTDIGFFLNSAPTPGANDISQLLPENLVPPQNDYGLNYYDNNSSPPGETFTTGASSVGFVMTNLVIGTVSGGGGNNDTSSQTYTLRIYSVSGTTATLIGQPLTATLALPEGDWADWSGFSIPLAQNTKYAYTFESSVGYEHMLDYSGNVYAGGQICTIPTGGGTIAYGTGGANYSVAGFDVGLGIPQTPVPTTPTYTPNVSPVYAGTVVTLNEASGGPGPFTYYWFTDNGSGNGETTAVGGNSSNLVVDTTSFTTGTTYSYDVVVSNSYGSATSGVVALSIVAASAPTVITDISASPNTTTSFVGLNETFTVSFAGTLPITYAWEFSTDGQTNDAVYISAGTISGTNETLTLSDLQTNNTGYYILVASNSVSPYIANSSWAQLTVEPITDETFTWQAPVTIDGLTASQILTTPPGYFLEGAYFGTTAGPIYVTNNGEVYSFFGNGSAASISSDVSEYGNVGAWLGGTNTTGNASLDTVLNNYTANASSTTPYHTITLHNLQAGQQYSMQLFTIENQDVGRFCNFQDPENDADISATYAIGNNDYVIGTFTAQSTDVAVQQNLLTVLTGTALGDIDAVIVRALSYQPAVAPTIVTQPVSETVYVGRTVQFTSVASGIPLPAYQWQKGPIGGPYTNLVNGVQISGVTNTTLTITGVTLANSGEEFVLNATNTAGSVQSSPADLTVLPAPALSGAYSTNVLALGPVAYWPLNETNDPSVGGLQVYDASGNNYDGLYGVAAENAFNGILGPQPPTYPQFTAGTGALEPTANLENSWANVPALNLITNADVYVTITMWLNPTGAQAANAGLLVNRNSGTVAGLTYDGTGTQLAYVWNNNDANTWGYGAGPVVPTDTWSFVALIVTPINAQFYVINTNGTTNTTFDYDHEAMAWNGSISNIYLGADEYLSRVFNGAIADVAVFNYALTPTQLQNLAVSVNSNPATLNFGYTVTGTLGNQTLTLSWDSGHQGWQLYTNSVGLTATNSWFPVPGSASVTSESIAINPGQPNVFFQMRYSSP